MQPLKTNLPPGCELAYRGHFGSDMDVCNDAYVSTGKQIKVLRPHHKHFILSLARRNHTSPFRHCVIKVFVKMPIFVERQMFKHQVGVAVNSISGRYVDFSDEYAKFDEWRKASESIKQGSLLEHVDDQWALSVAHDEDVAYAKRRYQWRLSQGLSKEQARGYLPLVLMTQCVMTFSLHAAAHFYNLRFESHAQREIQPFAYALGELCKLHFPWAWQALTTKWNVGSKGVRARAAELGLTAEQIEYLVNGVDHD